MSDSSSQSFLKELDKKLWTAAHNLRALAEGKKGGQYFTLKSIVSPIGEIIERYQRRVYNPAVGSGGLFVGYPRPRGVRSAKRCRATARGVVQSERFMEEHGDTIGDIMVFGQESNPSTWRLMSEISNCWNQHAELLNYAN